VALLDDRRGDVRADLRLGAPGPQELDHAGVHPVDRGAGGAQFGDLAGVLAHAQLAQHRAGQGLGGLGQGIAQAQHVRGGHGVGHREPGRAAGEVADQQVRVLAVGPGDDLDASSSSGTPASPGASSLGTTSAGGARWPWPAAPGRSAARGTPRRCPAGSAGPSRG
jgi:hypothetical protein